MVALSVLGLIIGAVLFDLALTQTGQALRMRRRNRRLQVSGGGETLLLKDRINIKVAPGFFHHRGHAWLSWQPDGKVVVGVNGLLPRVVGRVDEVRPPERGEKLQRGRKAVLFRRGNNVFYLLSPVSGYVVETNPAVVNNPDLPRQSPYADGWLYTMMPTEAEADMPHLMVSRQAEGWVRRETERMREFFEELFLHGAWVSGDGAPPTLEGILELLNKDSWVQFKNQFIYQQEWRG
jgi:glycine cleavage system H protein